MRSLKSKHAPIEGFSLLELAVVITIISIIVAGGLTLTTAKTEQTRIENTHQEMQEIATAISVYVQEYGCMPYPADITALPGAATYGREPVANAECATAGGTGSDLLTGGVPFYSLGLPDEYGQDDWNYRYLYVVSDTAVESTFSNTYVGIIELNDSASNTINTDSTYVLVSHGKTALGGYTAKTGAVSTACGSTTKDSENCDADDTFIDADYNNGDITANFYDDLIVWKRTSSIYEGFSGGGGGGGGISTVGSYTTMVLGTPYTATGFGQIEVTCTNNTIALDFLEVTVNGVQTDYPLPGDGGGASLTRFINSGDTYDIDLRSGNAFCMGAYAEFS